MNYRLFLCCFNCKFKQFLVISYKISKASATSLKSTPSQLIEIKGTFKAENEAKRRQPYYVGTSIKAGNDLVN